MLHTVGLDFGSTSQLQRLYKPRNRRVDTDIEPPFHAFDCRIRRVGLEGLEPTYQVFEEQHQDTAVRPCIKFVRKLEDILMRPTTLIGFEDIILYNCGR